MAISAGIDLRYPLGCLGVSPLDLGITGIKVFFWIDSQPHGTPGQAGQVAVIGTQITQPRAPPPQQAKTGLAGDPGLCHTGVAGSEIPELRENSGTTMISKNQRETEVPLQLGNSEARWGD